MPSFYPFKLSLFLLFALIIPATSLAQIHITGQDFDADTTWGYSSSVPYFSHKGTNTLNNVYPEPDGWNGDGFYGIIDFGFIAELNLPALSGDILGERDLDDEGDFGTSGDAITSFETIDLSSYNNVTLSFDYDIEGYNANSDGAFYKLYYNGFDKGRDTLQTGSTTGDDAEGSVSVNVPDTVNTCSLEVIVNNNGFNGYSGFDNFLLEGTPTNTIVEYTAPGGAVMEDAGTYNLDLEIHAPDMTASTSVDVALVSGNASDVNGFSSQTVTFPGGSSANESVNLTISDNNNCDGDRDLVFELQNVSGGDAATLGIPSQFTLTIQDDESNTTSTISPAVCDSFTVPSGDTTYHASGTYMDTIPNSVGCDSIITIDLNLDTSTSAMITTTACDSFTVPSGDTTYHTSGTYMDTISNSAGCDSVMTFDLSIDTSTSSSIAPVVCNSYTVPSGDTTYTSSGVYMDTIPNMTTGCDSLITIDLTIDTNTYGSLSPTTCVSYTVPSGDTTYTSSGMYKDTLVGANAYGCDSIIDIDLTVNPVDTSVTDNSPTLEANAPSSASFQWIDCSTNSAISGATGQSFTASSNGDYAVEVTQNGCTDTSSCYSVDNVGIERSDERLELSLHPNPTDGSFIIETGQSGKELDVRILDLQGREVYEREGFRGGELRIELDRPDGLYFVHLRSEKGSEVLKLVKE